MNDGPKQTYELLTEKRKVLRFSGVSGSAAAFSAADPTGETVIAWRLPRVGIYVGATEIVQ